MVWFGVFDMYVRLKCAIKFLCSHQAVQCPPQGFPWLYTSSETSMCQLSLGTKEAQDESARCSVTMGTFSSYPECKNDKNYITSSSDYPNNATVPVLYGGALLNLYYTISARAFTQMFAKKCLFQLKSIGYTMHWAIYGHIQTSGTEVALNIWQYVGVKIQKYTNSCTAHTSPLQNSIK